MTRFEGKLHFGNFFGWFWGSEIRKLLWLVLGFRNSETSLAGFGVPKFGNFFGWFWGSEIRKLLWLVLGFRNSEPSLAGFWGSEIRKLLWVVLGLRSLKGGGRNASNNLFLIIFVLRSSQNLEVK